MGFYCQMLIWACPSQARVGLSRFASSLAAASLAPTGFDPSRVDVFVFASTAAVTLAEFVLLPNGSFAVHAHTLCSFGDLLLSLLPVLAHLVFPHAQRDVSSRESLAARYCTSPLTDLYCFSALNISIRYSCSWRYVLQK